MNVLADLNTGSTEGLVTLLLVIFGLAGLGLGVWAAFTGRIPAAIVSAVIGLICLVVALG